jgi:DNA-directed RNA polymerase specialized sigma24 family protein
VRDIESSAPASVTRAFDELLRKIHKLKSQLNRERYWRRDVNRSQGVEVGPDQLKLEESINLNLDRIENYIRRELFYLAISKPFAPEAIQPQEVVDQVFYEVSAHLEQRPAHLLLDPWMFQLAHQCVRDRARKARKNPGPEASAIDSEEEIFTYYHPQEDEHFSALLRQEGCDEDRVAQIKDMNEPIEAFIGHLSEPVREAFVLNVLEGFDIKDVAVITGQPTENVEAHVSAVRNQIRAEFCG